MKGKEVLAPEILPQEDQDSSGRGGSVSPLPPEQVPGIHFGSFRANSVQSRVGQLDEQVPQDSIYRDDPVVTNTSAITPAFDFASMNSSAGPSSSQGNNAKLGFAADGLNSRNDRGEQLRNPTEQQSSFMSNLWSWSPIINRENLYETLYIRGEMASSCGKSCIFTLPMEEMTCSSECAFLHCILLMKDEVGTNFMRSLFDKCSQKQLELFILVLKERTKSLVQISQLNHGRKCLQRLIRRITPDLHETFMEALRPVIIDLFSDQEGSYVIEECLQRFPAENNKYIFEKAQAHCIPFAKDKIASRVLKKCIDRATIPYLQVLLVRISDHALKLARDQFGTSVVQFILELKIPWINGKLISKFKGRYCELSTHKFAYIVVKKCLQKSNKPGRTTIILELAGFLQFDRLLKDRFAIFVISCALKNAKDPYLRGLLKRTIRSYSNGESSRFIYLKEGSEFFGNVVSYVPINRSPRIARR